MKKYVIEMQIQNLKPCKYLQKVENRGLNMVVIVALESLGSSHFTYKSKEPFTVYKRGYEGGNVRSASTPLRVDNKVPLKMSRMY